MRRAPTGWNPAPEVRLEGAQAHVTLTVRQQDFPFNGPGSRESQLCYTYTAAGNKTIARAPVLRVRAGQTFSITLRNKITNSATIDSFIDGPADPGAHAASAGPMMMATMPGCTQIQDAPGAYPRLSCPSITASGVTNLHTHGLNVSPNQPQDEVIRTCINPVQGKGTAAPGMSGCVSGAYTYSYAVPDDEPPSLYWYHPHPHGESEKQVMMGLVGALIVEDTPANPASLLPDDVIVIRDLPQRQPPDNSPAAPVLTGAYGPADPRIIGTAEATCPLPDKNAPLLPGSPATRLLINDSPVAENGSNGPPPDAAVANLKAAAGQWRLWRLLNGAADTYVQPHLTDETGAAVPMHVLAQDGVPFAEPQTMGSVLVSPAGRVEFMVQVPQPGHRLYLDSAPINTGCAGDGIPPRRLALLTADPQQGNAAAAPPALAQWTSAFPRL